MHSNQPSAAVALIVALVAGGTCDEYRQRRAPGQPPPADSGVPAAGDAAPDAEAATVRICPGSTADPATIALVGLHDGAVVAVRADGEVMRVPLGRTAAWTNDSLQVWRSGPWTVVLFVSRGERGWNVMRFDRGGNLTAHVRGTFDATAPPLYTVGPVSVAPDGQVTIRVGPKDYGFVNDVIVHPDGGVERRPAGVPDTDGWVAIEAGFFRVGTGETRPLAVAPAYGKRRLAMAGSPARVFYLAEVDGAAALVAETAASPRVMPLPPLTRGFPYSLGPFDIAAGAGDSVVVSMPLSLPVARHRIGADELVWLVPDDVGPTLAGRLLEPRTFSGFTLVSLDGYPQWSVDTDTDLVVDYRATPLGAVRTPRLFFGTGAVFALDGATGRWWRVDRVSRHVSELDSGVGGAGVGAVAAGRSVLLTKDGLPAAILDLDRGAFRSISVPGLTPDPQRTRLFPGESRILFVSDGTPSAVLDLGSDAVLEVAGRSDVAPAAEMTTSGRWVFGTDDDRTPLWRADIETAELRPFLPVLPPDLFPLGDPRFLVDASVVPSPGTAVVEPFFVFDDGTVALARRDDVSATVFTAGPDDPEWRPLGRAISGLWGIGVKRSRWSWTLAATNQPSCFCNVIPQIRWTPSPPGREPPVAAPLSQVLPHAAPDDPLITPPAAVLMNADQSCALVTPLAGAAPFALDFQTGSRFELPALTSPTWVGPETPPGQGK
jgi:hypothetical protein